MGLGPHASFIIAAYAVAALVIVGLIAWVLADHRAQRRLLTDLEARGITRRSGRKAPEAGSLESGSREPA
jgi:heme exporter protein D